MSDFQNSPSNAPEPDDDKITEVRDVRLLERNRFGKWFANIWYHYKFQIVATITLLAIVIIATVYCINKPKKATFQICYAGKLNFGFAESGDIPTRLAIEKSLYSAAERVTGEKKEKKLDELIATYGYLIDDSSEHANVLEASRQNKQNLRDELNAGACFIFLLDENIYQTFAFSPSDRKPYMVPVIDYLPEDTTGYRITDDGLGVYLHSIPLGNMPGFKELPENTILCLRTDFSMYRQDPKLYKKNASLFREMLSRNFTPPTEGE